MRRRRAGVAAVLASAALVAGCGGDRVPSTPDAGPAHTAVTPPQAVQVLQSVNAAVVRAVQAGDAGQFGARVVGPERQALTAAITVQRRLKATPAPPAAPTTPRLILTLAGPWPRWFAVAGTSPAAPTPVMQVLLSAGPRAAYGLWGQLSLLPGAVLPEVASATVGSPVLSPATTGLAATPADALAHYADLLSRGDSSAYAGQFAPDKFRQELSDLLASDQKAFAAKGVGQVAAQHTVAADAPLAVGTQDGGALVIGWLQERYTVTVTPGKGTVQLDPQLAALAGRSTIGTSLERGSVEVLAFHVPKAGTADRISLLAASRTDVSATGS